MRVLAGYVALLAVATLLSIVVAREALQRELDQRIDEDLVQESRELRQLAGGNDPETGEPFDRNVERIFEVYMDAERSFPERGSAHVRARGAVSRAAPRSCRTRSPRTPTSISQWTSLTSSDRGTIETPIGPAEYLAVPLLDGDAAQGVFVAAIFRDRESEEVGDAVRVAAGVGLAMLLVGSVLAWLLADRVLRPVKNITETARSISGGDLSRRIPESGHDEIGVLAETFNDMLTRLETVFERQQRFVDDAGHELRTPITIVRGHLELLEDDPRERRETLALVMDELDRMGRIVNDLLTLAKWEQPDFLAPSEVDLDTLMDDVLAKASALRPSLRGSWTPTLTGRSSPTGSGSPRR